MSAVSGFKPGGLPGLGQLGTLVAIGVGLAALVMVMIYLPHCFRIAEKRPRPQTPPRWWSYFVPPQESTAAGIAPAKQSCRTALMVTGLVLIAAGAVLCVHRPGLDRSGNALRPQRGEPKPS